MTNRLIVALDTADIVQAEAWAKMLAPHVGMFKVGMELFVAHGAAAVHEIARYGYVMLDLKLHDIPVTVERTVRALLPLTPRFITIHASGGADMVRAARAGAGDSANRPLILAVTVLTMAARDHDVALDLARMALDAGADGVVCSPAGAYRIRMQLGSNPLIVCPGVRPVGVSNDGHVDVVSPAQASLVADWIVVGRPITQAHDPVAAARKITEEMWKR